ncbi:MAG: trypsin-like serine protease [Deltaproteobacteria bacterium]|nr:trypsin-like serine protease [Deltaproteobacteria bacterium]
MTISIWSSNMSGVSKRCILTAFSLAVTFTSLAGCMDEEEGIQPHEVTQAISDGTPLAPGQHEYVVRFYVETGSGTGHCSGTLIGQDKVLTAAHCECARAGVGWVMFGSKPSGAGYPYDDMSHSTDNLDDPDRFYISSVSMPPGYICDTTSGVFDVAVVTLERSVPVSIAQGLNPSTQVMYRLPTLGYQMLDRDVTLVGQGLTNSPLDRTQLGVLRWGENVIDEVRSSMPGTSGPLGASFYLLEYVGSGKQVGCGGDSGGPLLLEHGGVTKVIGVQSAGGSTCAQPSFHAAVYSIANGRFLSSEFGVSFPYVFDEDDDGIDDLRDNCPWHRNANQNDDNSNLIGDVCDTCPWSGLYDTRNSNLPAEEAASSPEELADVCDPVPIERLERPEILEVFAIASLVQGDGSGPDDVIDVRSSTYLGRSLESDPVGMVTLSDRSTFRWCNCVDPSFSPPRPLPISSCVRNASDALCTSLDPISSGDWKQMTLTPKGSAPAPDAEMYFPRSFSTGESLDDATWEWSWYSDLSADGATLLDDSGVSLQYSWTAVLGHVDKSSDVFVSERDNTYNLRDSYRLVATGPIPQFELNLPEMPFTACAFPGCNPWWPDCPMCDVVMLPIISVIRYPFVLSQFQSKVLAVRTNNVAIDITENVSLEIQRLLGQAGSFQWLMSAESGALLNSHGVNARAAALPLDFSTGMSPVVITSSAQGIATEMQGQVRDSKANDALAQTVNKHAGPTELEDARGVFSALNRVVYLSGGTGYDQSQDGIWQYDIDSRVWSEILVEPAHLVPSEDVFSTAYDPYSSGLYVLDLETFAFGELEFKFVRLIAVDIETGEADLLNAWPYFGRFEKLAIGVTSDSSVVLIGSTARWHMAWRYTWSDGWLQLDGTRFGYGTLLDQPFMTYDDLVAPIQRKEEVQLTPLSEDAFPQWSPCRSL